MAAVGVGKSVHRQDELFFIVGALRDVGRLAQFLHCGDEQPYENGDDRDHHQEFDQREGWARTRRRMESHEQSFGRTGHKKEEM